MRYNAYTTVSARNTKRFVVVFTFLLFTFFFGVSGYIYIQQSAATWYRGGAGGGGGGFFIGGAHRDVVVLRCS